MPRNGHPRRVLVPTQNGNSYAKETARFPESLAAAFFPGPGVGTTRTFTCRSRASRDFRNPTGSEVSHPENAQ